jgi:NTP pyrophosphatase (non-canonical NTP hydrolase)
MKLKASDSLFPLIVDDIKRINKKDNKSLDLRFIKFSEEYGEMCAEFLKFRGFKTGKYDKAHLKEEMADTLQCLISIYNDIEIATGISLMNDVLPEVFTKNKKWEAQQINESKRVSVSDNIKKPLISSLKPGDKFSLNSKRVLISINGVYQLESYQPDSVFTVIKQNSKSVTVIINDFNYKFNIVYSNKNYKIRNFHVNIIPHQNALLASLKKTEPRFQDAEIGQEIEFLEDCDHEHVSYSGVFNDKRESEIRLFNSYAYGNTSFVIKNKSLNRTIIEDVNKGYRYRIVTTLNAPNPIIKIIK